MSLPCLCRHFKTTPADGCCTRGYKSCTQTCPIPACSELPIALCCAYGLKVLCVPRSLPREIVFNTDGTLGFRPAGEVSLARDQHYQVCGFDSPVGVLNARSIVNQCWFARAVHWRQCGEWNVRCGCGQQPAVQFARVCERGGDLGRQRFHIIYC